LTRTLSDKGESFGIRLSVCIKGFFFGVVGNILVFW